jgi:ABC-type multidrug transport system ATPase subunit
VLCGVWCVWCVGGYDRNRTIICTIHQPRADIFQMIDMIVLLSKGNIVYFGNGGDEVLRYFRSIGYPCPDDMNPADFFCTLFYNLLFIIIQNY